VAETSCTTLKFLSSALTGVDFECIASLLLIFGHYRAKIKCIVREEQHSAVIHPASVPVVRYKHSMSHETALVRCRVGVSIMLQARDPQQQTVGAAGSSQVLQCKLCMPGIVSPSVAETHCSQ
jgi:hypothetical protein